MTRYKIWRARHRARLLSRYTPDADIAALYWVGREKYTVGLFRDGREVKPDTPRLVNDANWPCYSEEVR